jgi:hypothetical protein
VHRVQGAAVAHEEDALTWDGRRATGVRTCGYYVNTDDQNECTRAFVCVQVQAVVVCVPEEGGCRGDACLRTLKAPIGSCNLCVPCTSSNRSLSRHTVSLLAENPRAGKREPMI